MDIKVAGLTLKSLAADQRLVHMDRGARQRESFALRPRHQHHGAEAGCAPDTDCRNGRPDVLHGVVDRQSCGHRATWRVDVDLDLLVRVVSRQVHELGNHEVGDHVVDGTADQDDSVPEQARVDVERSLAVAAFVLDDGWDVGQSAWQLTRNHSRGRQASPAGPLRGMPRLGGVWEAFGSYAREPASITSDVARAI